MNRKKIMWLGVALIVAMMILTVIGMFLNRMESREPTPEELAKYQTYDVGKTKTELLEQCRFKEESKIGDNVYSIYESDTLQEMLYQVKTIERIAVDSTGNLFIQYTDQADQLVTMGMDDTGIREMAVCDTKTDLMFHRIDDMVEMIENFSAGLQ